MSYCLFNFKKSRHPKHTKNNKMFQIVFSTEGSSTFIDGTTLHFADNEEFYSCLKMNSLKPLHLTKKDPNTSHAS